MSARRKRRKVTTLLEPPALPALRFDVPEAAHILRMSRAQIYIRLGEVRCGPRRMARGPTSRVTSSSVT